MCLFLCKVTNIPEKNNIYDKQNQKRCHRAKKTPHAEIANAARGDCHRRTRGLKRRLRG